MRQDRFRILSIDVIMFDISSPPPPKNTMQTKMTINPIGERYA